MRWSERQRAMLAAMGITGWWPRGEPAAEGAPADDPRDAAGVLATIPASAAVVQTRAPAEKRTEAPVQTQNPTPTRAPASTLAPPAGSVATMDWPALREAVAGCTACRLCESRRQTVFGVGNREAHWMIVGEAPGEQEDREGEPFVGKSGRLLDNMLQAIGLTRGEAPPAQQVYIANTLKCRPPGNRNPQPDELARCEPYLARQLQLVQPRIILAMGRFAVQSLLRSSAPVGALRGKVHRFNGVPLIVTYHPAYLLRNLADKARAWDDLCLARETAAGAGSG